MDDNLMSDILESLSEIKDDSSVPKNVKIKIDGIISVLKQNDLEISIRVDKAQQELDDICSDTNLQSFTRNQLWNVVSLLEMLL